MRQKEDWHLTEGVTHELGRGDPFAAAIRGTRMPMVITDPRRADNPIVFVNEAFQKLTGYDREEIIGRNCRFLQGPDTDPAAVDRLSRAIAAGEPLNIDLRNYKKDGSPFWNALYVSPVRAANGELQFFFASQMDVSERYAAQDEIRREKARVDELVRERTADLQAALEAKTTLLHEVDHRVKNNLTMIGSLLRLQARSIPDPAVRSTLDNMLARVDALATVHRKLYQSDDVSRFDVSAFAESLIADVIGSSGRADIRLETQLAPASIPASKAASVGLILNEIATNAIKHAYADGRAGALRLTCRTQAERVELELVDDGCGFDPARPAGDSIGRTLIERLSRQIGAETAWRRVDQGMAVSLSIPCDEAGG